MKKICLFLFMFVSANALSQSIAGYKYAIVKSKFQSQKKVGQYNMNQITKLFLEKNGYTTFLDSDILPGEVTAESCDKFYVDVEENNNILTTKLKVVIKDCRNAVLFTSEEGTSKEKDYTVSNIRALRMAFKSFDKPEFRYDASQQSIVATQNTAPVKNTPEEKAVVAAVPNNSNAAVSGLPTLFAQPIDNGFQLVDSTPKVVMKIYRTSQPEVFMVSDQKGMLVKKDGQWFHEFYENDKLVSNLLNIKF